MRIFSAALAMLALFVAPAFAQLQSYAPPGSVRTIDRASCDSRAALADPAAELKVALGAHRRFVQALQGKFRTNTHFIPPPRQLPANAPGVAEVAGAVRALGPGTAALIVAGDPLNRVHCLWLIDGDGLVGYADAPRYRFEQGARHPFEAQKPPGELADAAAEHWPVRNPVQVSGAHFRRLLDAPNQNLTAWRGGLSDAANVLLPPSFGDVTRFDRLLILPTGELSDFPFAALPVRGGPLGLKTAIVQLTDVTELLERRTYRFNGAGRALIVGEPLYARHPAFGQPPPLPNAEAEARAVLARFPNSDLLVGAAATLPSFRTRLPQASYVHLATHGLADGVNPQDGSVLAFTGGYLTAREIAALDLRATKPLVVMSACQTGLGKNFPSGVFGLARSWLYAGAGQVVMSQWDVHDGSTRLLMEAFARALAADPRPEYALREAFRTVAGSAAFQDPYFWSGFVVMGPPSR